MVHMDTKNNEHTRKWLQNNVILLKKNTHHLKITDENWWIDFYNWLWHIAIHPIIICEKERQSQIFLAKLA